MLRPRKMSLVTGITGALTPSSQSLNTTRYSQLAKGLRRAQTLIAERHRLLRLICLRRPTQRDHSLSLSSRRRIGSMFTPVPPVGSKRVALIQFSPSKEMIDILTDLLKSTMLK
jgi:hypothetical protein